MAASSFFPFSVHRLPQFCNPKTRATPCATTTTRISSSHSCSDRFFFKRFHHIEFWCTDAVSAAARFSYALGIPIVAISGLSTGNLVHSSFLLRSGDLILLFSSPYSTSAAVSAATAAVPTFCQSLCRCFAAAHGLGVRAVAVEVDDAVSAFSRSVANGAEPSASPMVVADGVVVSEVGLYGDVVLRYISYRNRRNGNVLDPGYWFMPGFECVSGDCGSIDLDFGIRRLDHAVGNVPELGPVVSYIKRFTGFHEFMEFTAEDVGTSESGLNSVVLASDEERVILPLNEPVSGTRRKSQIQTFLDHNEGPGVQHLALATGDIFRTLREMKRRSSFGGFGFMPSPSPTYYWNLKNRAGDVLTDEQIKGCEELGILVDRDDRGVLLQVFTKPVVDRPTLFLEIIQRIGCHYTDKDGNVYQKGGCGGFGKGNFSHLFKSVEDYEKTLETGQPI